MPAAVVENLTESLRGRYTLERELGRGGMATVWLAHDVRHDRAVALKVLHPELAAALGPERFEREIRLTARLSHPHILPVLDSGGTAGLLWYAMPLVEGGSLRDLLRGELQLEVAEAVRIARAVAGALSDAHAHGIVHRDIKPENVLLERVTGRVLVADFGIARALESAGAARLTETGIALGTPAYMSPEQAEGRRGLDGRADVYSLGCVLYEMLAGTPPFTGPTSQAILARHATDTVPPLHTLRPTVPSALEAVILRALAKVPADRYATAAQLDDALAGARLDAAARRRPGARRLALGAVAAALGAGAVALWQRPPPVLPANAGVVAVLPFRVAGNTPELEWLREGIVDLLAIKLGGVDGLRAAEPRAVLRAWHDVDGERGAELGPDGAAAVARRVGAGQIIDGSVVGTSARLTLSASLLAQPSGRVGARASVEGPADSLPALVDRLATQLLGQRAGLESERLSALTSTSLPAVREYLGGQAAHRRGRIDEALRRFGEALRIDSTFALAALEMASAAIWSKNDEARARGTRLALAGRARLGPADRALLEARTSGTGGIVTIRNLEAAAAAYPERPQILYELGDAVYHWGLLSGLEAPLARAEQVFRRAWMLDSSTAIDSSRPERAPGFAEALTHMAELAHLTGDTAALRSLVALAERADPGGASAWYMRWHFAAAREDARALDSLWALPRLAESGVVDVFVFTQWSALARGEAVRSLEAMNRFEPDVARMSRSWFANNGGRPAAAALVRADRPDGPDVRRLRIRHALYWDGDTALAAEAARWLTPRIAGRLADTASAAEGYLDLCTVGQWRLTQGDTRGAEETIRRLRTARLVGADAEMTAMFPRFGGMCAAALEGLLSDALARPDAPLLLARFDSLARTDVGEVCCGFAVSGANLLIARLAERQGDLPHALAAVRRRAGGYNLAPLYLSTFLREEGRLAALTGDTAGAVRAYQHYLALRPSPEPRLRPQVEMVRAELARLVAER